ncbi:hypothetical protein Z042_04425 [Chania multitudinisentens RB-25]|uniref:DUF2570 domain-containing protein n=1 Tax=Chania multitudinisentens RB-25 TaxID=1441930 RepID=W0L576_9GAMM|nr:DUF2570 domain-containing protein [Chania multitudinisentens]AHG18933.1 hypothetical protein Z042_04425 [Chania multitudinisentens RB-25]
MIGWLQKWAQGGFLVLLLVAISLGWYSSILVQRLEIAQLQLREQRTLSTQQIGVITRLQTQDVENRVLMAIQLQQEQQWRQQYKDNQRKYRDAIKNNACAEQPMPDAVLELLRPTTTTAIGAATAAP